MVAREGEEDGQQLRGVKGDTVSPLERRRSEALGEEDHPVPGLGGVPRGGNVGPSGLFGARGEKPDGAIPRADGRGHPHQGS